MCTVSNIGDGYRDTFPDRWSGLPTPKPFEPWTLPDTITKKEFDELKKEVQELKKLIKAAKRFDDKTNQTDCEMDEKVEFIKKIADVGVDLEDVFSNKKK